MTKGAGQAVLNLMVEEKILNMKDSMYFLDPIQLAKRTGVNYADCMMRRFGPQAIEFVKIALTKDLN